VGAPGFTWQDGERTVRFGVGALEDAPALLGEGFTLLTTPRAAEAAPAVVAAAGAVHHVGPGAVDALAAGLRPTVGGELLVALGGGRPIDVAKALAAAAGPPVRAAAIPTTLSAAEMTRVHRHAAGVPPQTPRVRPAIVLNDPALTASLPDPALAASAANALGHALEAAVTTRASPVPVLAAQRAVGLVAEAYGPRSGDGATPDRPGLALAALLAGYALDASGFGLHHVLAQTLVREAGIGHGVRQQHGVGRTVAGLGDPGLGPAEALDLLTRRLAALAGTAGLTAAGIDATSFDRVAEAAAARSELDLTPPRASAEELRALLERAS
jgi:alcohol dehydrogenase class IV